jgi:SAM-dependent methyltransferase
MSFTQCPLCGASRQTTQYQVDTYSIVRCLHCDMMWLSPQPSREDLSKVYDDHYFSNENFLCGKTEYIYGYSDYAAERFNKQATYVPIAQRIKSFFSNASVVRPRLLDVGCGLGYFMDVAHDEGFDVNGLEFNAAALATLKSKYVFPVWCDDFQDFSAEPYDVITMFDVIEHLRDPFAAIHKANALLPHNGILALTTMDCGSFVSRLLGARLEDFRRVREHLFFFTRPAIRFLLEKHGFSLLAISFHGHTFRLDLLSGRLKMSFPFLGSIFDTFVRTTKIGHLQFHINPMTKMLILAQKTQQR